MVQRATLPEQQRLKSSAWAGSCASGRGSTGTATGAVEGVLGAESWNTSCIVIVPVPVLSSGIPNDSTSLLHHRFRPWQSSDLASSSTACSSSCCACCLSRSKALSYSSAAAASSSSSVGLWLKGPRTFCGGGGPAGWTGPSGAGVSSSVRWSGAGFGNNIGSKC